jgi:DUF1680 family protein
VSVNGEDVAEVKPGEYLPLRRKWQAGDWVELVFDMKPQVIHANPAVADDRGRIALQRGPIVFCMEQVDQLEQPTRVADNKAGDGGKGDGGDASNFPRYVALLTESTSASYRATLLDGVVMLEHPGAFLPPARPALYQEALPEDAMGTPTTLRMIPYYAWSNRQLSAMQVWIPYRQA